jgi:hypothetical protein
MSKRTCERTNHGGCRRRPSPSRSRTSCASTPPRRDRGTAQSAAPTTRSHAGESSCCPSIMPGSCRTPALHPHRSNRRLRPAQWRCRAALADLRAPATDRLLRSPRGRRTPPTRRRSQASADIEINQHVVVHVFGDKAVKAANRLGDSAVVVPDQLTQILGVMTRRERGRADEVAEHHRFGLRPKNIQGRVIKRNSPVRWRTSFETDLSGICDVAHVCLQDLAEGPVPCVCAFDAIKRCGDEGATGSAITHSELM